MAEQLRAAGETINATSKTLQRTAATSGTDVQRFTASTSARRHCDDARPARRLRKSAPHQRIDRTRPERAAVRARRTETRSRGMIRRAMNTSTRYRMWLRAFSLLLAVVAPAGCALVRATRRTAGGNVRTARERDVIRPHRVRQRISVLKMATPSAAPAYASSRMAYIEQPYRIDYFAQQRMGRSAVADAEDAC